MQVHRRHGAGRCHPHSNSYLEGRVSSFSSQYILNHTMRWAGSQFTQIIFKALIPLFDGTGLKVKYRGRISRLVSLMRSVFSSMLLCWSSYLYLCWVLWLCAWIFTSSCMKNALHSTAFYSEGYGGLVLKDSCLSSLQSFDTSWSGGLPCWSRVNWWGSW